MKDGQVKLRSGRYVYRGVATKVRQIVGKILQESEHSLFHVLVLEDLALMPHSRGRDVQDATKTFLQKRLFWPISKEELDVLRDGLILNEATGFTRWQNPLHTDGPSVRLSYQGGVLVWAKQQERLRFEDRMSSITPSVM